MASTSLPALPKTVFNPALHRKLLNLWFKNLDQSAKTPSDDVANRWFGISSNPGDKKAFDEECRSVAMPALDVISPEKYPLPAWTNYDADRQRAHILSAPFRKVINEDSEPRPENDGLTKADIAISLSLLLDQMPRNIFRSQEEQKKIYIHYDRLARALSYSILGQVPDTAAVADISQVNKDPSLTGSPVRKNWILMPLMHSESLQDHDRLGEAWSALSDEAKANKDDDVVAYMNRNMSFETSHRKILEKFGRYVHRNDALGRETTAAEKQFLEGGGDTFGTK